MAVFGVFLIAIGAVLTFAVHVSVRGLDLGAVGVILMIAGALTFLIGLFQEAAWADRWRRRPREIERDPRY